MFDAAECPVRLPLSDLVIDAAYGTGYRASCRAPWTPPAIGGRPVLAVDIPSGVDGSTGEARRCGAGRRPHGHVCRRSKPGLLFGDGPSLAGEIEVVDIGLDVSRATSHVVEAGDVAAWLPRRPVDAHKWSAAVRIVAGPPGMLGAAGLAARGGGACRRRARGGVVTRRLRTGAARGVAALAPRRRVGATKCSTASVAIGRSWWVPVSVVGRRPLRRSAG